MSVTKIFIAYYFFNFVILVSFYHIINAFSWIFLLSYCSESLLFIIVYFYVRFTLGSVKHSRGSIFLLSTYSLTCCCLILSIDYYACSSIYINHSLLHDDNFNAPLQSYSTRRTSVLICVCISYEILYNDIFVIFSRKTLLFCMNTI